MKKFIKLGLVLSLAFIFTNCANPTVKPEEKTPTKENIVGKVKSPETQGTEETDALEGVPTFPGYASGQIPTNTIIYFDYNQASVNLENRELLEEHAAYLISHPNVNIRLEGHADERGSREYNLALGEMRAKATKRLLSILGVDERRITVLSYGEEKPTEFGHSEMSWQANRRVEIIYP